MDRDVGKALGLLDEVGAELERKKEASHRVKALRSEAAGVQHDMDEVEAQLRALRSKSERLSLWLRQHQHQVGMLHALRAVRAERARHVNRNATCALGALMYECEGRVSAEMQAMDWRCRAHVPVLSGCMYGEQVESCMLCHAEPAQAGGSSAGDRGAAEREGGH